MKTNSLAFLTFFHSRLEVLHHPSLSHDSRAHTISFKDFALSLMLITCMKLGKLMNRVVVILFMFFLATRVFR